MFHNIRWRIATAFLLLLVPGTAALAAYLSRPACIADRACFWQGALGGGALMALGVLGVSYLVAERTAKPLRQLTAVANRIAAGDRRARVLPQSRDEVGMLTTAFTLMTEQLGEELIQLGEESQQLATAVQHMADGLLIIDDLGYVHLINPAAVRLLETTEAKALGRSFAEVVRHHQLIELWQRCRKHGKEEVEAVEIGRNLFLQTFVTPIHEQGARGYLVILQDLTTVRHLQTVRRDFISNISHELRTPLASLRAVVETLADSAIDDPPTARRFLGRAERELDVLTQMVEELLELSRIESGQVPLRLTATAVSELVLLPVERIREQALRDHVQLVLNIPSGLPRVLADAGRVHQVLSNLLHNAIKFTPEGGTITIRAYTKKRRFPDQVVIAVKDRGVGIAPEDLPRIFERFYKSDKVRTRGHGGTGLGLAISRHIVQAHNGRIWVKSKEKKGSTFYFTLPIAQLEPKETAASHTPTPAPAVVRDTPAPE